MNKIKVTALSIATIFLVAGCTPEEQQMTMQMIGNMSAVNGMGGTMPTNNSQTNNNANYQQGLRDGCITKQTGKVTRNQNGYAYDSNYKEGWNRGYAECKISNTTTNQPITNTASQASYNTGANDGCTSKQTNQLKRDNYKYSYDANYKAGWTYGYNKCQLNSQTNTQSPQAVYAKGEQDGCYSAQYGQTKRDNYLYSYDKNYQNGWNNGYQSCKR